MEEAFLHCHRQWFPRLILMNSRERVFASINHHLWTALPWIAGSISVNFWIYSKPRITHASSFWTNSALTLFVGWTPYPNQFGQKTDNWRNCSNPISVTRAIRNGSRIRDWSPDFAGVCVADAVGTTKQHQRVVTAHTWGIVEGTSTMTRYRQMLGLLAQET